MGALLGDDVHGRRGGPRLQAPRPVAHVLERGRRPLPHPRADLPRGLRGLLRGAVDLEGIAAADPEAVAALCERYAIEIDPTSIPGLVERFGVRFPAEPLER